MKTLRTLCGVARLISFYNIKKDMRREMWTSITNF